MKRRRAFPWQLTHDDDYACYFQFRIPREEVKGGDFDAMAEKVRLQADEAVETALQAPLNRRPL